MQRNAIPANNAPPSRVAAAFARSSNNAGAATPPPAPNRSSAAPVATSPGPSSTASGYRAAGGASSSMGPGGRGARQVAAPSNLSSSSSPAVRNTSSSSEDVVQRRKNEIEERLRELRAQRSASSAATVVSHGLPLPSSSSSDGAGGTFASENFSTTPPPPPQAYEQQQAKQPLQERFFADGEESIRFDVTTREWAVSADGAEGTTTAAETNNADLQQMKVAIGAFVAVVDKEKEVDAMEQKLLVFASALQKLARPPISNPHAEAAMAALKPMFKIDPIRTVYCGEVGTVKKIMTAFVVEAFDVRVPDGLLLEFADGSIKFFLTTLLTPKGAPPPPKATNNAGSKGGAAPKTGAKAANGSGGSGVDANSTPSIPATATTTTPAPVDPIMALVEARMKALEARQRASQQAQNQGTAAAVEEANNSTVAHGVAGLAGLSTFQKRGLGGKKPMATGGVNGTVPDPPAHHHRSGSRKRDADNEGESTNEEEEGENTTCVAPQPTRLFSSPSTATDPSSGVSVLSAACASPPRRPLPNASLSAQQQHHNRPTAAAPSSSAAGEAEEDEEDADIVDVPNTTAPTPSSPSPSPSSVHQHRDSQTHGAVSSSSPLHSQSQNNQSAARTVNDDHDDNNCDENTLSEMRKVSLSPPPPLPLASIMRRSHSATNNSSTTEDGGAVAVVGTARPSYTAAGQLIATRPLAVATSPNGKLPSVVTATPRRSGGPGGGSYARIASSLGLEGGGGESVSSPHTIASSSCVANSPLQQQGQAPRRASVATTSPAMLDDTWGGNTTVSSVSSVRGAMMAMSSGNNYNNNGQYTSTSSLNNTVIITTTQAADHDAAMNQRGQRRRSSVGSAVAMLNDTLNSTARGAEGADNDDEEEQQCSRVVAVEDSGALARAISQKTVDSEEYFHPRNVRRMAGANPPKQLGLYHQQQQQQQQNGGDFRRLQHQRGSVASNTDSCGDDFTVVHNSFNEGGAAVPQPSQGRSEEEVVDVESVVYHHPNNPSRRPQNASSSFAHSSIRQHVADRGNAADVVIEVSLSPQPDHRGVGGEAADLATRPPNYVTEYDASTPAAVGVAVTEKEKADDSAPPAVETATNAAPAPMQREPTLWLRTDSAYPANRSVSAGTTASNANNAMLTGDDGSTMMAIATTATASVGGSMDRVGGGSELLNALPEEDADAKAARLKRQEEEETALLMMMEGFGETEADNEAGKRGGADGGAAKTVRETSVTSTSSAARPSLLEAERLRRLAEEEETLRMFDDVEGQAKEEGDAEREKDTESGQRAENGSAPTVAVQQQDVSSPDANSHTQRSMNTTTTNTAMSPSSAASPPASPYASTVAGGGGGNMGSSILRHTLDHSSRTMTGPATPLSTRKLQLRDGGVGVREVVRRGEVLSPTELAMPVVVTPTRADAALAMCCAAPPISAPPMLAAVAAATFASNPNSAPTSFVGGGPSVSTTSAAVTPRVPSTPGRGRITDVIINAVAAHNTAVIMNSPSHSAGNSLAGSLNHLNIAAVMAAVSPVDSSRTTPLPEPCEEKPVPTPRKRHEHIGVLPASSSSSSSPLKRSLSAASLVAFFDPSSVHMRRVTPSAIPPQGKGPIRHIQGRNGPVATVMPFYEPRHTRSVHVSSIPTEVPLGYKSRYA